MEKNGIIHRSVTAGIGRRYPKPILETWRNTASGRFSGTPMQRGEAEHALCIQNTADAYSGQPPTSQATIVWSRAFSSEPGSREMGVRISRTYGSSRRLHRWLRGVRPMDPGATLYLWALDAETLANDRRIFEEYLPPHQDNKEQHQIRRTT